MTQESRPAAAAEPPESDPARERAETLRRAGVVLASLAILLALIALVGWATGVRELRSAIPGEVTMKPNTAVAIVLLGVAVISLGTGRRPALGYAAAALAAAIGGFTLIEYATGWNPGVDTLLFSESVDSFRTPEPGRMAPNSAASFLLCGVALLLWSVRIRSISACNVLLLATSGVGLLALIGYSADVQDLFGLSATVTSMALPTATAVLFLGIGGLLLRPGVGVMRALAADGADGEALRTLLPVTIIVPILVGLVVSRLDRGGSFDPGVGFWLLNLTLISCFIAVTFSLSRRLGAVDRERLAHQRELEQRSADLALLSDATRQLARTTEAEDARKLICEVASEIAEAPIAVLLEPARDGRGLYVSAWSGREPAIDAIEFPDGAGEAEAFVTQSRILEPDMEQASSRATGSVLGGIASSAVWQPVMRGSAPAGVLAIAWERRRDSISSAQAAAIEAIAADAAVAIERATVLRRLDAMARTDDLTGLHNRRAWEEELDREIARAARDGKPLCVAMLDLDRFKEYNDRHGHQAGDRLLRETAAAWRSALRVTDLIARYGGEEFGLLLPDCDLEQAVDLSERLRELTPGDMTSSCGVAEWDGAEPGAAVVGRADAALYEAKRAGRDRTIAAPTGA